MLQKETVDPGTFSFLEYLAQQPELKGFSLVGGTALSLQLGHRISTDLDFFSMKDFDNVPIRELLERESAQLVYSRVGVNLVQATIDGIKIYFAAHKYPRLKEGIEFHGIDIFSVEDISAMKLGAILSRAKKRDYVDIARIVRDIPLEKILTFFKTKYNQKSTFHVIKALGYFVEVEQDVESLKLLDNHFDWEQSKVLINKAIRDMSKQK